MKYKTIAIFTSIIMGLAAIAVACTGNKTPQVGNVQKRAVAQQQAGLTPLLLTQPPFFPSFSDERKNINERTARFADPNHISYISVFANTGGVLFTGVVKGKISSVDSQVTPADGLDCQHFGGNDPRPDGCGIVQIAEPDGSWGTNNPNAIFWFDDKNVYHETALPYIETDAPQTFSTPPILTINAAAQSNKCDASGNNCKP